jgi:putative transcriptional regulator
MSGKYEKMSLFEQLRAGLEDSIAHSRGELTLVTTELPAPPPRLRAGGVKALRARLRMSQAVFAATLNVAKKTVQSWEHGMREPSDAALRILQVVGTEPAVVRAIFAASTPAGRQPTRRRATTSRAAGRSVARRRLAHATAS